MPREAKLFDACKGSPTRAMRRNVANVPPAWIERAHASRKTREPNVARAMKKLEQLCRLHPGRKVAIKNAQKALWHALKEWELAYRKENFYNGLRVLMELQRSGESER